MPKSVKSAAGVVSVSAVASKLAPSMSIMFSTISLPLKHPLWRAWKSLGARTARGCTIAVVAALMEQFIRQIGRVLAGVQETISSLQPLTGFGRKTRSADSRDGGGRLPLVKSSLLSMSGFKSSRA